MATKRRDADAGPKRDFREEVTAAVVEMLEKGTAPWQKPWDGSEVASQMPMNAVTDKPYRGGNAVNLMMVGAAKGYTDPRWMTYKQAEGEGWQVRKGEKAAQVEFWQFNKQEKGPDGKPVDGEKLERPIQRIYSVFNAQQIDGIPPLEPKAPVKEFEAIEAAERALKNSGAKIDHNGGDRAFYRPSTDTISLPPKDAFGSEVKYYATALHELGHWTGHESRLNRDVGKNPFGSEGYAREELRAEMASVFMQAELGVPHDTEQHAAYVGNWIEVLKKDKNELFRAAKDAGDAADFVIDLARSKDKEQEQTEEIDMEQTGVDLKKEDRKAAEFNDMQAEQIDQAKGWTAADAASHAANDTRAFEAEKNPAEQAYKLDDMVTRAEHSPAYREGLKAASADVAEQVDLALVAKQERAGKADVFMAPTQGGAEPALVGVLAQQEAQAKAWTPEQAQEQARLDVRDHALEFDPAEKDLVVAEMIVAAKHSPAYREALAAESPELGARVDSALDKKGFARETAEMAEAAKAWTPEQAQEQAARDVKMHQFLVIDALEQQFHQGDMALRAEANEDYAQAVTQQSPDLGAAIKPQAQMVMSKEDRKQAEMEDMKAERIKSIQGWSPQEAAGQVARDLVDVNDPLMQKQVKAGWMLDEIAERMEHSPAYRKIMTDSDPVMQKRIAELNSAPPEWSPAGGLGNVEDDARLDLDEYLNEGDPQVRNDILDSMTVLAEQNPAYLAEVKKIAPDQGEMIQATLDARKQEELMTRARENVDIRYGDMGAALVGHAQADQLKDAALHLEMEAISEELPNQAAKDAFMDRSPYAGAEKAQELDSATKELDYLRNLPSHVAIAMNDAIGREVLTLNELDAVAYVDKVSGDLTLATSNPETMKGIMARAWGDEDAHAAVEGQVGHTKVNFGKEDPNLLKYTLAAAGAENRNVEKIDQLPMDPSVESTLEESLKEIRAIGMNSKGDANIIAIGVYNAQPNGSYTGPIVAETDHHLLQKTGPSTSFVHEKNAFAGGVQPGVDPEKAIKVNYRNGLAATKEIQAKAMER